MSPSSIVDRVIHLITNSGPIGFALFVMSAVIFALRYFKPESVAFIEPSAMGYILCAEQRIPGFRKAGGAKGIRTAGTVAEFSLWGAGALREIPQPWS